MKKLIVTLLFLSVVCTQATEKIKKFFSRNKNYTTQEVKEITIQNPVYGMDISVDPVCIARKQGELQIRLQNSAPELHDLKLRNRRMGLAYLAWSEGEEEYDAFACDTDETEAENE